MSKTLSDFQHKIIDETGNELGRTQANIEEVVHYVLAKLDELENKLSTDLTQSEFKQEGTK